MKSPGLIKFNILVFPEPFIALKYNGWIRWFGSYDPVYPPASLIAGIFVAFVLVLRIIVLVFDIVQKRKLTNN